jgi:hypothetical protein
VPSSATSVTLSFWLKINTAETTTTTAFDTLRVQDACDVFEFEQDDGVRVEDVRSDGVQGTNDSDLLPRHRRLVATDIVRNRRHLLHNSITIDTIL